MSKKLKVKGIRSVYIFIPTIIIIGALYIFIIVATLFIDRYSISISTNMQETNDCTDVISDLQGSSSKLNATATSFLHDPVVGPPTNKVLNEGALNTYYYEYIIEPRKPSNIEERLKQYNLNFSFMTPENVEVNAKELIDASIQAAKSMLIDQSHAFSLVNSVSTIDFPEKYSVIMQHKLTNEEKALSDEEKLDRAFELLLTTDYSEYQRVISVNLASVTSELNSRMLNNQNEITAKLKFARGFLWGSILLILIVNAMFFFVLFRRLVFPIIRFGKNIDENNRLKMTGSLYEANYLATAYNSLLDRHKEFENELRVVAEFDSLTGLPNRYCYNEFLKKPNLSEKSSCVFLFDINNLKYTNDTYGHGKGDELIKNASCCIKECFLDVEGKNCYRIGGDEFVAILEDINEEDITKYIDKFNDKQKEYNVVIAVGYEYTDNIQNVGYEKLIIAADKKMYNNKEMLKKENQL